MTAVGTIQIPSPSLSAKSECRHTKGLLSTPVHTLQIQSPWLTQPYPVARVRGRVAGSYGKAGIAVFEKTATDKTKKDHGVVPKPLWLAQSLSSVNVCVAKGKGAGHEGDMGKGF